jgi:drug/metabolite transporter (DMT)-like permease
MNWIYLAFFASIFLSISAIFEKKILKHEHAMEFSAAFSLVVCVLTWVVFGKSLVLPKDLVIWALIYVASWCGVLSFYFSAKVTRSLALSTAAPILALAPGLAALFSWVLLGERLGVFGVLGILVMLLGACMIEWFGKSRDSVSKIFFSVTAFSALLGVSAYALGTVFDSVVVSVFQFDKISYLLLVQTFVCFNWIVFLLLLGRGVSVFSRGFKLGGYAVVILAVIAIAHRILYLLALGEGSAASVVAIKRSSVVWTTLAGFYFGEKSILSKVLASMVVLFGLMILLFLK